MQMACFRCNDGPDAMTKTPQPSDDKLSATAYVNQWIAHFNAANWLALRHLEGDKTGQDYSYMESQFDQGFRVVSQLIKAFSYPKWSIFNTHILVPSPTFWVDIDLEHADGRKRGLWLALAPDEQSFQTCIYAEKPIKKRMQLDLRKEAVAVRKFFAGAMKALRRLAPEKIKRVEVEFAPTDGELRINLNVDDIEPGSAMSHFAFQVLLRKNWLEFFESSISATRDRTKHQSSMSATRDRTKHAPEQLLIDLDGNNINFSNLLDIAQREQHFCQVLGAFLTREWLDFLSKQDAHSLPLDPIAEFCVQDADGYFAFPVYQHRQKLGRFFH